MKRLSILALAALIGALAACVPSLQPFYSQNDIVFDPALVGSWSQDNSSESWKYEKNGEKSYTLTYTDKNGQEGRFEATLFNLGEHRFLDLFPEGDSLEASETPSFYRFHLMPLHTVARVDSVGPTLVMAFMSPKWLEKKLEEDPGALEHREVRNRTIITAPTDELRAFVKEHAEGEGLFGKATDLLRD